MSTRFSFNCDQLLFICVLSTDIELLFTNTRLLLGFSAVFNILPKITKQSLAFLIFLLGLTDMMSALEGVSDNFGHAFCLFSLSSKTRRSDPIFTENSLKRA